MNNIDNQNPLEFYPLVMELEKVLGNTVDIMQLITPIDRKKFDDLRGNIVQAFQIGDVEPYSGTFGIEVELGDVSDAVSNTTLSIYPKDTLLDKPISRPERVEWCAQILKSIDASVEY